jgi:hypothetical protein
MTKRPPTSPTPLLKVTPPPRSTLLETKSEAMNLWGTFIQTTATINAIKRYPEEWKKIFMNHIADKRLAGRIYTELIRLDNNNKKRHLKNGQKVFNPSTWEAEAEGSQVRGQPGQK